MRIMYWSSDVCSSDLELTCESRSCDGEDCSDTVVTVQTIRAEQVLIAAGRRPNSDGLGLAERGISLAHSGGIIGDDYLETTVPGVYAAGDVTGREHRSEEHPADLKSQMRRTIPVCSLEKK